MKPLLIRGLGASCARGCGGSCVLRITPGAMMAMSCGEALGSNTLVSQDQMQQIDGCLVDCD